MAGIELIGYDEKGQPIYEIGGHAAEAERKKKEEQVYKEAQEDVIDPLNEETTKEGNPDNLKELDK